MCEDVREMNQKWRKEDRDEKKTEKRGEVEDFGGEMVGREKEDGGSMDTTELKYISTKSLSIEQSPDCLPVEEYLFMGGDDSDTL